MALFAKLLNAWSPWDDRWYSRMLAPETVAGVEVNESTAMSLPAVWACVRVIAEGLASLPLHLYERLERGKRRAVENPLYTLLHDRPNPEMTAMSFRETLAYHILTWGNCYAEKELDRMNRVKALWPIGPDRVQVYRDRDSGGIYYEIRPEQSGETVTLPRERMFHVPGLSYNGLYGHSPIGKMRESIGLTAATEEFGARFFGAGTHPGVVVSHPDHLSSAAAGRLQESLTTNYAGLGRSHRLLLLEEGMKLEKVGIPPEDAQFLETRRFQMTEICRIFRVPPHLIYELERATYSNIEHQSLEFVVHTLGPWLVRFEQAFNLWLLPPVEQSRYFYEHLVAGLLRGDLKSRYEAYAVGRNWGWLSADDIRELENMNPLPEGQGDMYLQPLNMIEAGTEPPAPEPPPEPEPEPPAAARSYFRGRSPARPPLQALLEAFTPVLQDAAERILRREANQLGRQWDRDDAPDLDELTADYYRGNIRNFMEKIYRPVIHALLKSCLPGSRNGALALDEMLAQVLNKHVARSRDFLAVDGLIKDLPHLKDEAAADIKQLVVQEWRSNHEKSTN